MAGSPHIMRGIPYLLILTHFWVFHLIHAPKPAAGHNVVSSTRQLAQLRPSAGTFSSTGPPAAQSGPARAIPEQQLLAGSLTADGARLVAPPAGSSSSSYNPAVQLWGAAGSQLPGAALPTGSAAGWGMLLQPINPAYPPPNPVLPATLQLPPLDSRLMSPNPPSARVPAPVMASPVAVLSVATSTVLPGATAPGATQRPRCTAGVVPADVRQRVEATVAAANPEGMTVAAASSPLSINLYVHVVDSGKPPSLTLVPAQVLQQQLVTLNRTYSTIGVNFRVKSVTRVTRPAWSNTTKGSVAERSMKTQLRQGGAKDLNVYLLRPADSSLGWSNFPWEYGSTDKWRDGVVINTATMPGGAMYPYNVGYTMVHEVGHWLGLLHVFEGGCSRSGDGVADTKPQQRAAYGCPLGANTCPSLGSDPDPVWNFMSYTDDSCMKLFTPGQGSRVREMWKAFRGGNTTTTAPTATVAPISIRAPSNVLSATPVSAAGGFAPGLSTGSKAPAAAAVPAPIAATSKAPAPASGSSASSVTSLMHNLFASLSGLTLRRA